MPTKFGIDFSQKKSKGKTSGLDMIAGAATGSKDSNIIAKQKIKYKTPTDLRTLESDVDEEISETLRQFRESVKAENDLRNDNIDIDFYTTIVFNNSMQRHAFFTAIGVKCKEHTNMRFINGVKLAELMGITLPKSTSIEPGKFKVNRELLSFCHNPKKQNG